MEALGRNVPPAEYIDDEWAAREFIEYADKFPEIAVDTETTGTDIVRDTPLFFSLAAGSRRVCVPILLLPEFAPILESSKKLKVLHTAKFDMHMIDNARMRVSLADPIVDIKVLSVREDTSRPNHQLKYLCADGLYHRTDPRYVKYPSFSQLFGTKDIAGELLKTDNRSKVVDYASMDAWVTLVAYKELRKRLEQVPCLVAPNLWELFCLTELETVRAVYEYERLGVLVNPYQIQKTKVPIVADMQKLVEDLSAIAGKPINPNSTPQLQRLVYEEWGYKPTKLTKGGASGRRKPSVDEGTLRSLLRRCSAEHKKFFEYTLEYRSLGKLVSDTIHKLEVNADPFNRVHTTFDTSGARTGRFSSSDPNIQNIPSKTDTYRIRECFIAPPGQGFICVDFDQLEMKILAARSGDERMIEFINSGADVHCKTVEMAKGFPYAETKEAKRKDDAREELSDHERMLVKTRSRLKSTGFGIAYGQTKWGSAAKLGISVDDAQEIIDSFFGAYPGVKDYIERTHRFIQTTGYAETALGWRRKLPAGIMYPGENYYQKRKDPTFQAAMRAGLNLTIQGSAADIMRILILRVHRDPLLKELQFRPAMMVHDELCGYAPVRNQEKVRDRIVELAKNPLEEFGIEWPVDITASGHWGRNWREAK